MKKVAFFSFLLIAIFGVFGHAFAASNIDPVKKYSQFLNVDLDANGTNDFINWAPTNGGATVGDAVLTGYVWGETTGWINLNPSNGGVTNTCSGILGGYAWGQNTGWINFSPSSVLNTSDQPKINITNGNITGTVWSQNYGWIQLSSPDVSHPGLVTTWHGCTNSNSNGSGSGTTTGTNTAGSIFGCTNPTATNYNHLATVDDGSCVFPITTSSTAPTTTVTPPGNTSQNPPNNPPPGTTSGSGTVTGSGQVPPPPNPNVQPSQSPNGISPGHGSIPIIAGSQSVNGGLSLGTTISNIFRGIDFKNPSGIGWLLPLFAIIGLLSSVPGLITRFGNLLLTFFLLRKKTRGIVYDSETKEPLDPAYVSVVDAITGQEVGTAITDMEGRFGFVLKKGSYKIVVNKTHYQFPSSKLAGKTADEVYDNLYFGEVFTVTNDEQVVTMSVPMDAIGTDWNQQEKRRMGVMRYLIENYKIWGTLFDILFVLGFVASIVITYYDPIWWNFIMIGLYIIIAALQFFGYGPVSIGKITKDKTPLAYAVVRVINTNLNREVAHKITSDLGGYFILVPKADYHVTIDQKNTDGTYTKIFTSQPMRADHGMINRSFDL